MSSPEILALTIWSLSVDSAILLVKNPLSFKSLCFVWEETPVEGLAAHPLKLSRV